MMWRLSCLVVGNAVVREEVEWMEMAFGFCRVEMLLDRRLRGRAVVRERDVGAWGCSAVEFWDIFHDGETCHSG